MTQESADRWLLAAAADPKSGLWGLVRGGPEPRALAQLGPPPEWQQAPELELTVTEEGFATPLARTPDAAEALSLLQVAGMRAAAPGAGGGESPKLDTPAIAVARPALSKLDSIRFLAAFFPDGRAVALSAVRPKGGRSDKDVVSVLVAGADVEATPTPLQIFDPRLSTTYDAEGLPLRAGVELWLGADEDGDQRPLRLSAESTSDRLVAVLGDLHLEAYAQRCHSRGEDGMGVYALLRPR